MRNLAVILIAIVLPMSVAAQSPTELLKGRWVNDASTNVFCGQSIYVITGVDPDGTVRGTFECVKQKFKATVGGVINQSSVKAFFSKNRLVMENVFGGGNDLTLNGTKLEGTGKGNAESAPVQVTFIKQ